MEAGLRSKDDEKNGTIEAMTLEPSVKRQRSHPSLTSSLPTKEVFRSKSTNSRGRLRITPVPSVPPVPTKYSPRSPITPILSGSSPSAYHAAQSSSNRPSPANDNHHNNARAAHVNRLRANDMRKYVEKGSHRINQDGRCNTPSPKVVNASDSALRDYSTRVPQASVTRLGQFEKPKLLTHSPTFPILPDRTYGELQMPVAFPTLTRNRGASTSHRVCRNGDTAVLPRPSTAKPDYGFRDALVAKQRDPFQSRNRHPDRKERIDGTGSASSPVSDSSTEVRASFRSVMTSSSSLMDASSTERSSVVTKSSSMSDRTNDLSYDSWTKHEDFSVDDAISMYAAGFNDDEGLERGHEETAPLRNDELAGTPRETAEAAKHSIGEGGCGLSPPHVARETPGLDNPGGGFSYDVPLDSPTIMNATETRDRYGFRKATQHVTLQQYDAWNKGYTECLSRRKPKWQALMREHGLSTHELTCFPPKSAKTKRFVRKGIPPEWRGAAWFWYAGGVSLLQKHPGLYRAYLDKCNRGNLSETDAELIERDLHRTFPDNIRFKPDQDPSAASSEGSANNRNDQPATPETPLVHSLRRVLRAFSIHNPRIGYCQSLNFLAGLLLLFLPEEKAFWMLVIITTVYLPGTHEVSLEGANVDLWVLMGSIKESMPTIWTKVTGELDGSVTAVNRLPPITLCTTAWFMSCFIGTLPIETVLRVWDVFFYEGSKTLFRIALAIFKVGETEIKAVSDPMEIFQVVQTIPRRLIDAGQLMDVCFRRRNGFGHLRQETVEDRRRERRKMYADERIRAFTGGGADDKTGASVARSEGSFRQAFRRVRTDSNIRLRKMHVKRYDSHRSEGISPSVRAIIRLLHLRASGQLTEGQWRSLLSLESHGEEYRTAGGSLWKGVESDCESIKDWTGTDVDEEILQNLLCSFFINSMALHAPGGQILGSCLDPDAALMNHSCDPNADYYFEGPELRVRSTRTIPTGEEITISYIDPTLGFGTRQEKLRSMYFFECECQKCEKGPTGPGELTIEDPELDRRFKEAQDRLRQLLQTDETSPEVVEVVADRLCRDGYPGKPWPSDVQPMPQLWSALATAYQDTNLVKALRFWLKTCLRADPLMRPSRYDFRRVEHFMKYLGLESAVVNLLCANDPTVRELQLLKSALSVIQYPHVKRFVQDATRAFGEDSTIAHVARISERKWDDLLGMQGTNPQELMSFWASAEGISELKREEAKVLDWAENFDRSRGSI